MTTTGPTTETHTQSGASNQSKLRSLNQGERTTEQTGPK